MVIFGAREDCVFDREVGEVKLRAARGGTGELPLNRLYCTTESDFARYKRIAAKAGAPSLLFNMPADVLAAHVGQLPALLGGSGEYPLSAHLILNQLRPLAARAQREKRPLRLAVMNGFGQGLGDVITGLTALRLLRDLLEEHAIARPKIDVLVHRMYLKTVNPVYRKSTDIENALSQPLPVDQLVKYDGVWDLAGCLRKPTFSRLPLIDFFLDALGCDASAFPKESKNNAPLPVPASVLRKARGLLEKAPGPKMMFHAKSSNYLRDMPDSVCRKFLDYIVTHTGYSVISLTPMFFDHPRFFDFSRYSQTFDDYCGFIASVNALVTVDTSTYHIAAGYDIPSVVLFSTVPPTLRTPYYPSVTGMLLPDADQSPFFMKQMPKFPTPGAEERAALEALWGRLDFSAVLEAIVGADSSAMTRL